MSITNEIGIRTRLRKRRWVATECIKLTSREFMTAMQDKEFAGAFDQDDCLGVAGIAAYCALHTTVECEVWVYHAAEEKKLMRRIELAHSADMADERAASYLELVVSR